MNNSINFLKGYIGRFIIVGRSWNSLNNIILYGITRRSQKNKQRKLIHIVKDFEEQIKVVSTQNNLQNQNLYNAITIISNSRILVSNSKYILSVKDNLIPISYKYTCEDDKYNTPRICACINKTDFTMGIFMRKSLHGEKSYFHYPLISGNSKAIATYYNKGVEPKVMSLFNTKPINILLPDKSLSEIVYYFWNILNKKIKVSIVGISQNVLKPKGCEIFIINKEDE